MYYWSTASTDPAVYHDKTRCPDGERILSANKQTSFSKPANRRYCEECPKVR
jgi:hypothetical protein